MKAKTHGFYLGRFQPLHLGHQAIINEIYQDGLNPIILLGSPNAKDERNPLSADTRRNLLQSIYDGIIVEDIFDHESWDEWASELLAIIKAYGNLDEAVVYYYPKVSDYCSYNIFNTFYNNTHYLAWLRSIVELKIVTYPTLLDIEISATNIRDNLAQHKHYLDHRVYAKLQGK